MKFSCTLLSGICIFILCCSCGKSDDNSNNRREKKTFRSFVGMSYRRAFNDLQEVHMKAAKTNGIGPLDTRADTTMYNKQLVRIPDELDIFKVDNLTHSIPYLVPAAADLLTDIALNFRDSLDNKMKPLYKIIVTSVTRTNDDVRRLRRRNYNAQEESSHCYGTTFDIAWVRYVKLDETDERELNDGQLKAILGQVLFDLKERDRCYIKHERKQSCFHITVR